MATAQKYQTQRMTGLSFPSVNKAMEAMAGLGIVRTLIDGRRNRDFIYDRYLNILSEGAVPL